MRIAKLLIEASALENTSRYLPFSPFLFGVSLLKLNRRKKRTLISKGLLGNLGRGCVGLYEVYRLHRVYNKGCFRVGVYELRFQWNSP